MTVKVLRPGLLTTLQDYGRHGFQRVGLCPGGAMDKVSLTLANALVGNALDEAALEMTVIGPEILFEEDTLVAVCGAEFQSSFLHNRFDKTSTSDAATRRIRASSREYEAKLGSVGSRYRERCPTSSSNATK